MDYRDSEDHTEEDRLEGIEPEQRISWRVLPGRETGELSDTLGAELHGLGLDKIRLYQQSVHLGYPEGSLANRLVSGRIPAFSRVRLGPWSRHETQILADLEDTIAAGDEGPRAANWEQSDRSFPLPRRFLDRMPHLLQARLPQVDVHLGDATDRFLRYQRADAAAIGTDVYVRTDRYEPETPAGLGLLGHELVHVAQQQSTYDQPPIYPRDYRRAEHRALIVEQVVKERLDTMREYVFPSAGNSESPSEGRGNEAAAPQGSHPVMLAEESRDLGIESEVVSASGALNDRDLNRIKDEVYSDLMMRIRQDSERGA